MPELLQMDANIPNLKSTSLIFSGKLTQPYYPICELAIFIPVL
jgi:hypothetical protein